MCGFRCPPCRGWFHYAAVRACEFCVVGVVAGTYYCLLGVYILDYCHSSSPHIRVCLCERFHLLTSGGEARGCCCICLHLGGASVAFCVHDGGSHPLSPVCPRLCFVQCQNDGFSIPFLMCTAFSFVFLCPTSLFYMFSTFFALFSPSFFSCKRAPTAVKFVLHLILGNNPNHSQLTPLVQPITPPRSLLVSNPIQHRLKRLSQRIQPVTRHCTAWHHCHWEPGCILQVWVCLLVCIGGLRRGVGVSSISKYFPCTARKHTRSPVSNHTCSCPAIRRMSASISCCNTCASSRSILFSATTCGLATCNTREFKGDTKKKINEKVLLLSKQ